ncbi:MAG: hypothetical protein J2P50_16825 [Hyphomicrobiaceae bacterium]|nr:hypothetical protein [Hyphomicrobiaceae bacterium]
MSIKTASFGAASLLAALAFAGPALADGISGRGHISEGPATRPCSTAGNVGLTTDYVFRGISQNNENPAVQGGVDLTCGNFYFGVWGSNVDQEGTLETDVYGGYKTNLGHLGLDVGLIYYAYPGTSSSFNADYLEVKAALSGEIGKGGTLSGTVFYSPDYTFDLGAVTTLEGTFTQALPRFSIFTPTFGATVGRSFFADKFLGQDLSYTYWNVGVTLGFREKWSLDLRYHGTDGEGFADTPLADDRFVGTVKYSF